MNNYLLQLLKEVKTIIIPGLGALTLTNEHTGEMMFMSYLKFDDGNLAKHIAEKEGIDINDAKNLIAKFVREVTAQLDKGESYDMYQFGTFRKVDGEVTFIQWEAGAAASDKSVTAEVEEAPKAPEPIEEKAADPVQAEETPAVPENSIREELPVSESEAMGAAIAAAIVSEPEEEQASPVMEEVSEPEREEAVTAIVPEPATEKPVKEEPVVELTDKGFDTSEVPPAPPTQPFIIHESPLPVNDVPPVTKHDPGVGPSPKDIVEAKDARAAQQKKKTADPAKPKRKTSVISYILWGIVVLILGGGTYVAVNYDTLKHDFPILADFAGESAADREPEQPVIDSSQVVEEEATAPAEEVPAPEETIPEPEPAPVPPPVEQPVVKPAPVKPATPKPSKPRPSSPKPSAGNSSIAIGQPDPSKPFHVIGGSFGSEANAKRFARELISKGQPSVIVGETNGMYRVSIASFATKDEALAAHAGLKSMVPAAWVFKWP